MPKLVTRRKTSTVAPPISRPRLKSLCGLAVLALAPLAGITGEPSAPPGSRLVEDGQAYGTIVVPAHPEAEEHQAANLLQETIRRMTGVTVPIVRDDQPATGFPISVGNTRLAPARLAGRLRMGRKLLFAAPDRDAYCLATEVSHGDGQEGLFLVGHRPRGTLYAVHDFLERLGCRWFFACEAGTVMPRKQRLIVPALDVWEKPDFAFRYSYSWEDANRPAAVRQAETAWAAANRMSDRLPREGSSAHNFSRIWPGELYSTHPDYFPLRRVKRNTPLPTLDGRANPIGRPVGEDELALDAPPEPGEEADYEWRRIPGGQRCLSNPDVAELGARWALRQMDEHPDYEMVPFIQNDGMEGFCLCGPCTEIGSFADQNIFLANQVGKRFLPKHPDMMLHIIAYFESARVPRLQVDGYETGTDRVWVTLFSNFAKAPFDELVVGWSKASHHLEISDAWQFFSGEATVRSGWPRSYADRLQRYAFYRRHNVVGIKTIVKSDWARHGLARYLSAKTQWPVDADIGALVADFCARMFPNAADDFRRYMALYDRFERREIDIDQFQSMGYAALAAIRSEMETQEERDRWEFYALFLHHLSLERHLEAAAEPKDKLAGIERMVRFLRAIEDRGVIESRQRIWVIYLPRLDRLKWARIEAPKTEDTPPADTLAAAEPAAELHLDEDADNAARQAPPPRTFQEKRLAMLARLPPLELNAETIDRWFDQELRQSATITPR